MIIVGTRPELIRFAPVISELQTSPQIQFSFIHTGQHYSYNMDKIFFNQLDLPDPDLHMSIGPGSQAEQVSKIIFQMESAIQKLQPQIVCVWGDTNSSLAATIGAIKCGVPVAHIEAGYRSYDQRMPEETNRVLIDHGAHLLFPFCSISQASLKNEKVSGKIVKIDNPLLDIFLQKAKQYPLTDILTRLKIPSPFILVTSHRAENVDNPKTLANIVEALTTLKKYQIIFPVHPRTLKNLKDFGLLSLIQQSHITLIEPVGYEEMLDLLLSSHLVVTDSGGLQLEAFFAKKPCITIRKTTEWTLTVQLGTNFLADPETDQLPKMIQKVLKNYQQITTNFNKPNPYGQGKGGKMVVESLLEFLN